MTIQEQLNNLIPDIHNNAVKHGWWDEDRDFGEICALIHSELSEALEEYRAGRPYIWHECFFNERRKDGRPVICGGEGNEEECIGLTISPCFYESKKPEGIAVELADAVIRVLDYYGKVNEPIYISMEMDIEDLSFGYFISLCHWMVSLEFAEAGTFDALTNFRDINFNGLVSYILAWFKHNNLDLVETIRMKHEYNKTRPYKHGGKVI